METVPDPSRDEPVPPDPGAGAAGRPDDERYPWDEDPPPADPDSPRERHDSFNEAKKSVWLRALVKTGCVQDACRVTGVSPRTVYRHQENDPLFFEHCRIALRVSGTPAELTAWPRAVEGVEQEFACGGQVHVRRRYSDGLLRLILQGSNPKKYGPHPGFKRKRILKHERKQIEQELRAEIEAEMRPRSLDEMRGSILRKLSAIDRHRTPARLATGWTRTEDGHWIPPGYGWIGLPGGTSRPGPDEAGEDRAPSGADTPRESV